MEMEAKYSSIKTSLSNLCKVPPSDLTVVEVVQSQLRVSVFKITFLVQWRVHSEDRFISQLLVSKALQIFTKHFPFLFLINKEILWVFFVPVSPLRRIFVPMMCF